MSWLKKQLFGSKSERSVIDPGQESLPFDEIDVVTTPPEILEQVSYQRRKPVRNKGNDTISYPDDLPVERKVLDLPEERLQFGGKRKSRSLRT
ncbi:MAG: transposase domain-containing protein [Desulfuromonadaceae bacterium]